MTTLVQHCMFAVQILWIQVGAKYDTGLFFHYLYKTGGFIFSQKKETL